MSPIYQVSTPKKYLALSRMVGLHQGRVDTSRGAPWGQRVNARQIIGCRARIDGPRDTPPRKKYHGSEAPGGEQSIASKLMPPEADAARGSCER